MIKLLKKIEGLEAEVTYLKEENSMLRKLFAIIKKYLEF